jgi:hypothetical protein
MPRKQKLKVFCTPVGFHDAYVAAPSQKAALAAWGSRHDLFARGLAHTVDDPELAKEPLAHPGEVIRRSRGTAAEQIAALPKAAKRRRSEPVGEKKARPAAKKARKPAPRPDRAPLDKAEDALAKAEARQRKELAALEKRAAALRKERERLEKRQAAETARLRRTADQARERYERAMREWPG